MNINQLRYFLDAARLCNFTKAAEKNYISQSAITQQIKSLEQELETELFIRDKRKVELSPTGSVFIHEAEAILSRIVQAKEKVLSVSMGVSGIRYYGLHTPAGHLLGAESHCGRYHAFPGSASLPDRIHRTAFRRSGRQRRQPQTAVGFAVQ